MAAIDLQLYGAGGHGKVVAEAWQLAGGRLVRVVDDSPSGSFFGLTIIGADQLDTTLPTFISIGSNQVRKRIASVLFDLEFPIVTHPKSIVSPIASIDVGTLLMAGAVVNAECKMGCHCIVNTGAIVEHDCSVGSFVHIGPGAVICGEAVIEDGVLVGANATILPGIRIGANCVIGAGAVVHADVVAGAVVAGNPARSIR